MQNNPQLSVIVAAYNCELYVSEAIDSIINQSYTDWEMLISDDCSTDRTKDIIDLYNDPRIRRFHNSEHLGLVHTWNKLVEHAKGHLITWQDADDVSMPMRLEKLTYFLNENPEIMLCGSNSVRDYIFSGEKSVTNYPLSHEEILSVIEHERRIPFTGATRMICRDVLKDIEKFRIFFDGIGGEDMDFVLRLIEKYRVANIPDVLYSYRYTRTSNSRKTVNNTTFLKLYMDRVVFFLADQRKRDNGLDGLMMRGDKEGFDHFIESLQQEFEKDRSIIYRRACQTKISNQDYNFAFSDGLRAIRNNPKVMDNYLLLMRLLGSWLKTISRILKRKLMQTQTMV